MCLEGPVGLERLGVGMKAGTHSDRPEAAADDGAEKNQVQGANSVADEKPLANNLLNVLHL